MSEDLIKIEEIGSKSNIGELDLESIRIDGRRVDDLPIAEKDAARDALFDAKESTRVTRVNNVRAKYPSHSVTYLESRIRECEENIVRIRTIIDQCNSRMNEYSATLSLVEFRDEQIEQLKLDYPVDYRKWLELQSDIDNFSVKDPDYESKRDELSERLKSFQLEHSILYEKIKYLDSKVPPYDIKKMKEQQILDSQSIERGNKVISDEYISISTIRELIGLCRQRDIELINLGEKPLA